MAYRLWWQLPGPSRFVATISQTISDGNNVFIFLPQYTPRGINSAIRSALGYKESAWTPLRVNDEEPIDFLFAHFEVEASHSAIRNANALTEDEKFAEKIIWLEGLTEKVWGRWKQFFTDYGQACQHIPLEQRTLFCVPLGGHFFGSAACVDPLWERYRWRGVVSNLDMFLFASSMLQEQSMTTLQKRVATSAIAKLALWDPTVCERLVNEKLDVILNPVPVLGEIARERCWSSNQNNVDSPTWEKGMKDLIDGNWKLHSSILALDSSDKEINRRIWNAQMSVLLPLVEEARQNIIEIYAGKLQVPFETRFDVINDIFDLEINHINTQIHRGKVLLDTETQQLVHKLTEIRNSLSHLRTVTVDMLDSDVLNNFVETQIEREMSLLYRQDEDDLSLEGL